MLGRKLVTVTTSTLFTQYNLREAQLRFPFTLPNQISARHSLQGFRNLYKWTRRGKDFDRPQVPRRRKLEFFYNALLNLDDAPSAMSVRQLTPPKVEV
ncbi:hypothetical protein VTH06DRAFT_5920 [Thermothelomyces fergusii]